MVAGHDIYRKLRKPPHNDMLARALLCHAREVSSEMHQEDWKDPNLRGQGGGSRV